MKKSKQNLDEEYKEYIDKEYLNKRTPYHLPESILFFLIAIAVEIIPPRKANWFLFAIAVLNAIRAAIHDYKEDGELGEDSIVLIVIDVLCIAAFLYLAYVIKSHTVTYTFPE